MEEKSIGESWGGEIDRLTDRDNAIRKEETSLSMLQPSACALLLITSR